MNKEDCPKCKGSGTLGGTYYSERDCFECYGTGKRDYKKAIVNYEEWAKHE